MSRFGYDTQGRELSDDPCLTCTDFAQCRLTPFIARPCQKQKRQGKAHISTEAALEVKREGRSPDSAHMDALTEAAAADFPREVHAEFRSGSNQLDEPAPMGYVWQQRFYQRGPNDPPGNARVLVCIYCGEPMIMNRHKVDCYTVSAVGTEPAMDPVHPPHYKQHPAGIECIDVIEHLPFNVGTAIKYLWRAGQKPGETVETDLRKAIWYIEREIQRRGKAAL